MGGGGNYLGDVFATRFCLFSLCTHCNKLCDPKNRTLIVYICVVQNRVVYLSQMYIFRESNCGVISYEILLVLNFIGIKKI